MKRKITIVAFFLCVASLAMVSCSKKRCTCTTIRKDHQTARSYENLGSHKNCSELDDEWVASDTTGHLVTKSCVPES